MASSSNTEDQQHETVGDTAQRTITLKSNDEQFFDVAEEVAMQSVVVQNYLQYGEGPFPLPNVDANLLKLIIDYCKKHVPSAAAAAQAAGSTAVHRHTEYLKSYDTEFMQHFDETTLPKLLAAAHYMEIRSLLDLGCQTVADMIKGKTPEEIREMFKITDDLSPEKKRELRAKNRWAYNPELYE